MFHGYRHQYKLYCDGVKARAHKAKTKAKAIGIKAKAKDLTSKAEDLTSQETRFDSCIIAC